MAIENPLYPGYYPGDPHVREPPAGGGQIEPIGEFDDPNKLLDIEADLAAAHEQLPTPKWLADQLTKDFWLAATTRVVPKGKKYYYKAEAIEAAEAYGEEEAGELPGAFDIPLDFETIVKKGPAEAFKNMGETTVRNIFNVGDFARRNERNFWKEILSSDTMGISGTAFQKMQRKMLVGEDLDTLSIREQDVVSREYTAMHHAVVDLATKNDNVIVRPGAYITFQQATANAVAREAKEAREKLSANEHFNVDAGIFSKRTEIANEMYNVSASLRKVDGELDKHMFHFKDLSELSDDQRKGIERSVDNLRSSIRKSRESLDQMSGGVLEEAAGGHIREYVNVLDKLEGDIMSVIGDQKANYLTNIDKIGARRLRTKLAGMNNGLTRGNLVQNRMNPLGRGIVGNMFGATLSAGLDGEDSFAKELVGGARARRIFHYWRERRDAAVLEDFSDSISKGNFFRTELWMAYVKPRITAWTPASHLAKLIEKTNGFGTFAVLNDEAFGSFKMFAESGPLAKLFENKFNVKVKLPDVSLAGGFRSINISGIEGGKRFEFIGDFEKFRTHFADPDGYLFSRLSSPKVVAASKEVERFNAFHDWFNGDFKATLRKSGVDFDSLSKADQKALFSSLMGRLAHINGNPDFTDLTKQFVGWLGKYSSAANRLQTALQKKFMDIVKKIPIVNKLVGLGIRLKYIIAKTVSKAIMAAIAALTGGIAEALAPIIEKIIYFITVHIISKVERAVKKYWKIFVQLDFDAMMDVFDEGVIKLVKIIMGVFAICMVVVLMITILIMTVFLGGWAAVDHSVGGLGHGGFGTMAVDFENPFCDQNELSLIEYGFLSEGNTAENGIASTAYEIVNQLLTGFWCYWNRSPKHGEAFFNTALYFEDPFPNAAALRGCGNCLYWCTWLPVHSGASVSAGSADGMASEFASEHSDRYVLAGDIYVRPGSGGSLDTNVFPGAVAFINSGSWCSQTGNRDVCHVGIVYKVTLDYIIVIHSNAASKAVAFTIDDDGGLAGSVDGFALRAVGNP